MALKTKPFDPAKHFPDDESQIDLLNDAFASGHAGYISASIGTVARVRGLSKIASDADLNRQSLHKALSDRGNPTLDTLLRVLKALDLELKVADRKTSGLGLTQAPTARNVVHVPSLAGLTDMDQTNQARLVGAPHHSQPSTPVRTSVISTVRMSAPRQSPGGIERQGRALLQGMRNAA